MVVQGLIISIEEGEVEVQKNPAGVCNALARGQSRDKYTRDFQKGQLGEWVAHYALKKSGADPSVSEPDISRNLNNHDADLVGRFSYHVKVASSYGGPTSWVFQDTAISNLTDKDIFLGVYLSDFHYCRGSVQFAVPWNACMKLLKPMQKESLGSKRALYEYDLVQHFTPLDSLVGLKEIINGI